MLLCVTPIINYIILIFLLLFLSYTLTAANQFGLIRTERDIPPQENQTPEVECLSDTDSTDDRFMNNVSKQQDSLHFAGSKEPSPQVWTYTCISVLFWITISDTC